MYTYLYLYILQGPIQDINRIIMAVSKVVWGESGFVATAVGKQKDVLIGGFEWPQDRVEIPWPDTDERAAFEMTLIGLA